MKKLILLCSLIMSQSLAALISDVTIFEKNTGTKRQLVVVCGDRHHLGSWSDNTTQFLSFAQIATRTKRKSLFLIENLSSPNAHFDRPQDRIILQAKENYVLNNLMANFGKQDTPEITSILHFFGCTKNFYAKLGSFLKLPPATATTLHALPMINIDNRHREVYYGESLIGWQFEPYSSPEVRTIQQQESQSLTLFDLLAPQATLKEYMNKSSSWLRSIFEEILQRQENHKKTLFLNLKVLLGIDELTAASKPLATLAGNRQQELYRFLQKSSLQHIFADMIEANALWHITRGEADVAIVLAGTNHTGHTEGNFINQRPGLVKYLGWLGYNEIDSMRTTNGEVRRDTQAVARRVRDEVPKMIENRIRN